MVLDGSASHEHMRLGAVAVATRGSGGARLAVIDAPLSGMEELIARVSHLGPTLVARSSTTLEASGEWSGAFTSYLGLSIEDLPRAIVGCWASAFSVAALERFERSGLEPGSVSMSIIVQPALDPNAGGTARVEHDGTVSIVGVKGSPAPLLQGWVTGDQARWEDGWVGDQLIEMVGDATLTSIAGTMRMAAELLGATQCEWAVVDGEVWLLQLGAPPLQAPSSRPVLAGGLDDPNLIRMARTVVRAPGPLGEAWVLPWAMGGWLDPVPAAIGSPAEAAEEAKQLCSQLTAEVWGLPSELAMEAARKCMRALRGPDPTAAVDQLRLMRAPNARAGGRLLSLIHTVRSAMVDLGAAADADSAWYLTPDDVGSVLDGASHSMGTRVGVGQWEPFVASIVLNNGRHHQGTPASSGVGAGSRCRIDDPLQTEPLSPRRVLSGGQPVPALASLLWDAAGLVTELGSPAAHLFESARALGVPAVCGVDLPWGNPEILAVDGYAGVVASLEVSGGDDG